MGLEIVVIPGMGYSSNVFLVKGSEKCMLVDAGMADTTEYVLNSTKELLEGRELDILFLTHRHCDHIGGAKNILEATNVEILAPETEKAAIISGDGTTGASMFGVKIDPVPVTGVEDGHIIDLGNGKLKVMHTPGHTTGSVVLYDEEERALLSGDTVFAGGGVGRWDLPTGDRAELKSSLDMLCELPIDSLYPGHGPAIGEDAIEQIRLSRRSLEGWGI